MYEWLSNYLSSVAAPFHPFGGAVDIIVVQQQDGSFKSTPWYVRFGKFQGVLKLSTKTVTVAVNGAEADFHMHLDKTGQAYFLREVESDEEEDRASHSSDDDAILASRRESFKSAESRVDIEELVDNSIYGDEEIKDEADKIRSSSDVDGISMVSQINGEIFISFAGHSSNLSDKLNGNRLHDASSKSSRMEVSDVGESNLKMALDNRVDSALLHSENVRTQQDSAACPLEGELASGNEIQNAHNHIGSSKMNNSENTFVKMDVFGQTEYLGRVSENGWDSYKETSVFTIEGSSGSRIVSAGNISQTDGFVLSGYSAYDYENMDLPKSEDVSELRKVEDSNKEVVLMSVDGHIMTAPIISFKRAGSVNISKPQSEDKINPSGEMDNNCTEYGIDNHDLDHKEMINSSENQRKVAANNTPESIMQTQYGFSTPESCLDSERVCKQIGKPADSTHKIEVQADTKNNARKSDGCCLQPKIDAHEMPRTESEIEFAFNDEDMFKSCLALSELSPPTEEEDKQYSLFPHLEEEEEEENNVRVSHGSEIEYPSAAFQTSKLQALHAESSHLSDILDNSDLQQKGESMSDSPRNRSKPIHIRGPHLRGRGVHGQVSGSLPNMGVPSLSMETPVAGGVFSHSLDIDSSFCKRTINQCILTSTSGDMEPDVLKEKVQAAGSAELYQLNGKDSSNKSLHHDVGTDVEISLCGDLLSNGMGTEAAMQAFDSKRVSREEFRSLGAEIIKNEKLIVRISSRYFPWSAAAHIILGMVAFGLEAPTELEGEISVEQIETKAVKDFTSDTNVPSSGGWRWPFSFRRVKTPEKSISVSSTSIGELVVDPDTTLQSSHDKELEFKNALSNPPQKRKVRTNTPTSEQLASLNLKEGQNMITFTFLTSIWGKQEVDARIYLWKWNTRIVISDVDGTITKSDVLGQVMPLVGKDWTQTGVARLFSTIKDNGYQLLFLSARAIAQAYLTRQFLLNLKQDGKALPYGPVVISPDGLFPSLYREVIRRAPHEFKIACLEDIRKLFPPDCNPFYAGFGNRDTDEISYLKVGIPKGKIFIINPKGQIVVNHCVDVTSYTSLHKLANDMFPPMSTSEQEDYNSWNYWKVPLPDIEA